MLLVKNCWFVTKSHKGSLNEEVEVGKIQLHHLFHGPFRGTHAMVFATELHLTEDDLAEIQSLYDDIPDTGDVKKFRTIGDLIRAIESGTENDEDLYRRLAQHGIYDVVEIVTKPDFKDLLKFLRENNENEVIMAMKSPDFWSYKEGDEYKSDLRAGGSRDINRFGTQSKDQMWRDIIERYEDEIISEIKKFFVGLPKEWQFVLFGHKDSNIIVKPHKGDPKFNRTTEGEREYQTSIFSQYGEQPGFEGQGLTRVGWDEYKYEKMGNKIKEMIKGFRNAGKDTAELENLLKKYEAKYIRDKRDRFQNKKLAVYCWVTINTEPLIEVLSKLYEKHVENMSDEEDITDYDDQEVEVWQTSLRGLQSAIKTLAGMSEDYDLNSELLDYFEDITGLNVVNFDNDGNVYYTIGEPKPEDERMEMHYPQAFGTDEEYYNSMSKSWFQEPLAFTEDWWMWLASTPPKGMSDKHAVKTLESALQYNSTMSDEEKQEARQRLALLRRMRYPSS